MASFLFPTAAITLLLLVLSPSPSVAGPILDVDGDILQNGGDYYILPAFRPLISSAEEGGLRLTPAEDSSPCPLFITNSWTKRGLPVKISTLYFIPILTTSFPIIFSFDKVSTTCNKPLRWWVAPSDANNNSYVIVGTKGPFKPTYVFNIKEAGKDVYNIKFCHITESDIFRVSAMDCKDVTLLDDGKLGVAENSPFPFVFKKYSPKKIASYVD
ncbi:kunitz-type trypsin inhibitor alpha chain-like [Chenopodium quinoa]|uniref:kunitz-type trypsin inhibitor alpha chain-like n=1 Tax=Chenopodium quinoa TaxID=63459 RepID=UPI000B78EBE2|nr:kunitz-type trypsin inhibitor alpha chain-like [Chenopodium quinoa]XP_021748564.1 kunitz-type trypsin inhibitor alpha chain-like [Chenopodium quinoa]